MASEREGWAEVCQRGIHDYEVIERDGQQFRHCKLCGWTWLLWGKDPEPGEGYRAYRRRIDELEQQLELEKIASSQAYLLVEGNQQLRKQNSVMRALLEEADEILVERGYHELAYKIEAFLGPLKEANDGK